MIKIRVNETDHSSRRSEGKRNIWQVLEYLLKCWGLNGCEGHIICHNPLNYILSQQISDIMFGSGLKHMEAIDCFPVIPDAVTAQRCVNN